MAATRVLVTGAGGQLGQALVAAAPGDIELRAVDRSQLDVADADAVRRAIDDFAPALVINASAYTAVDRAEQEPEAATRANVGGPGNLAAALAAGPGAIKGVSKGAGRLLHVSTDYVFDGTASTPYSPDSPTAPLGVYGRTKLAGEASALATLPGRVTIVRTAWVYSASGRNFLQTMLRLMRERGAVRVVSDQVGTPTCTASLAAVIWALGLRDRTAGIFHWTDAGVASWYDFAVAIAEEAFAAGLLRGEPAVEPIATRDYPTPARRPAYSVLDSSATRAALGLDAVHWRASLRTVLQEMPHG
jgi:dTDP-4-dehydrorhamnose reductase